MCSAITELALLQEGADAVKKLVSHFDWKA